MFADEVIRLARKYRDHGNMSSSARLCLADAIRLYNEEDFSNAKKRALKSLQYSIGCFHKDYQRADTP